MKRSLLLSNLFCLLFAAIPAEAYVLKKDFYILNKSKRAFDVSYNECMYKEVKGKYKEFCEAHFVELSSGESLRFLVDKTDNNSTDDGTSYFRKVYVYQVVSPNSLGAFNYNDTDWQQFSKDYQGFNGYFPDAKSCNATKDYSVLLDDYGTDKVFCVYGR